MALISFQTVRGMSAEGGLILSNSHLNQQQIKNLSTFIRKSGRLRGLSGLIATLALFIIFIPSLAGAVQITLAWDSNDEPDLAGYIVYYGKHSRSYDYDVDVGDYSSVTISGLIEDVTYYFAVTAYDEEGNESDFSTEISYPVTSSSGTTDGSSGGGGGGGGCFITAASDKSAIPDRKDNITKFAMITLFISLLLAALLPRCVPLPRTRQQ